MTYQYLQSINISQSIYEFLYYINPNIAKQLNSTLMSNQTQYEQEQIQREPDHQIQNPPVQIQQHLQPQIRIQSISDSIYPHKNQQSLQISVPVPVVQNTIHYYKGQEKYQWRLEELQDSTCIDQLQPKSLEELQLPYGQDIEIQVRDAKTEGKGLAKHVWYYVSGRDKNGEFQCRRRYSQYIEFRRKLSQQWIGILIPILPSGTIGNSEQELTMRIKYIDNFWRVLSLKPVIFGSEEVQLFLRSPETDIEVVLKVFTPTSLPEIIDKYKNIFSEAYNTSTKEQFMYRRERIPVQLKEYEQYFQSKKIVLSEYKDAFRRLTDAKTRYYRAMSKLDMQIMPQYQDILTRWFKGIPIQREQQGVFDKLSVKKDKTQQQKQNQTQQTNREIDKKQNSVEHKQQSNQTALFSSQAFRSRLEDTISQVRNYNNPTWQIYDVLNFELKSIDMVCAAIEQVRHIQKEINYLKRSISINKQQMEAVATGKKTLKTFLMRGTEDEKRQRLTNENTNFEQKLQKITQLYHIMLVLMEQQLTDYHAERARHYQINMQKALSEDMEIARSIMEFHVYQSQLFSKEKDRRIRQVVEVVRQARSASSIQLQEAIRDTL